MQSRRYLWIGLVVILLTVGLVVIVTAALIPQEMHPAYAAAVTFAEAVGAGNDETAFNLLSPAMRQYVTANCPGAAVSGCMAQYTPSEWGSFKGVVFRRGAASGETMNVELIATYENGKGGSGVCIYQRMAADESGQWRVFGWAGYVPCSDPNSRNMATNPDAPNRVP
jgi:hypothetical protein